ncbi:MAG: hypothetical protein ACFE8U_16555, partial [Candidatus Hermodarchaeota archaeon]
MNPEKNCIANEDSNCTECDLKDHIICQIDRNFANRFTIGNTTYRVVALAILFLTGILVNQLWLMPVYLVVLILTFFILEPRLLCSHCPFYEKEGKVLKCWALRGMPKLWNYNPNPITKVERITMLSLGAFIDLFPLVGIVWGLFEFFMDPYDHFLIGIPIIILTIIFIFVMIYFTRTLLGHACQKCPNFSCAMNKTPSNIVEAFLDKNPVMKKAWQDSGWTS